MRKKTYLVLFKKQAGSYFHITTYFKGKFVRVFVVVVVKLGKSHVLCPAEREQMFEFQI